MTNLTSTISLLMKDGVSKPARSVAMALKDVENDIKAVAKGMATTGATDRFVASLGKLKLSKQDIESVATAWKDYSKSAVLAADASQWTKAQAGDVRRWESQTISALRAVKSETGAFYRQMSKPPPPGFMQRVGGSIAGTLGGAIVGSGVLIGAKDAVGAGATVQERRAQLRTSGATPAEIAKASDDYREFTKTHAGALEADYLASYKDARVIAPAEAYEMARLGSRYMAAARNSGVAASEDDVGNVLRIMDELGLKSMAQREDLLDSVLKSQQAFGSQISTETMLSAYRNAKQSVYDWSPEFRDKFFPTLLQSAGQQGGTEMMTALNNYIGGHMQASELKTLIGAGFVDNKDLVWDHNKPGLRPGAHLFEADVFKSNIAQWAWDFHDHYMKRKGATEDKFDDLIAKMPKNMAALIAFMVHNEDRIKRDSQSLGKPVGMKAEDNDYLADNPVAGLNALKDSIIQFGAAVTSPTMTMAGKALQGVASGIGSISSAWGEIAKAHPGLAALVGGGATAGALAGGGALTYGMFSGLMNGFGLGSSAVALDRSAAALTAAATRLGGSGVVGDLPGGGGRPANKGLGWGRWLSLGLGALGLAGEVADAPPVGSKQWADDANARNKYWDGVVGGMLPPGWVTPAPTAVPFDPNIAAPAPSAEADATHALLRLSNWLGGAFGGGGEAVAAPSAPKADASSLADIKLAAEGGKAVLGELNATVKPQVDPSSIHEAHQALLSFLADFERVGIAARSLPSSFSGARVSIPALGKTQRGNFTFGGVSGE